MVERRQKKDGSLPEEIKDDAMVKHRLMRKAAMEFMFQDIVDCSLLWNYSLGIIKPTTVQKVGAWKSTMTMTKTWETIILFIIFYSFHFSKLTLWHKNDSDLLTDLELWCYSSCFYYPNSPKQYLINRQLQIFPCFRNVYMCRGRI